eukprot:1445394-Amphidinium_carterae.1
MFSQIECFHLGARILHFLRAQHLPNPVQPRTPDKVPHQARMHIGIPCRKSVSRLAQSASVRALVGLISCYYANIQGSAYPTRNEHKACVEKELVL